jgi:geranylgeranyl diphosphate synthase type 3
VDIKKYAVSIMEKTGSFEYTKKVMKEYEAKIKKEIERLGGNQTLEQLLAYLADSVK